MKPIFRKQNERVEAITVNIDKTSYSKDTALEWGQTEPIRKGLAELKRFGVKDKSIWKELFDALRTGNLRDVMAKRYAKDNFQNWDNVAVRNEARERFRFLPVYATCSESVVVWLEDGTFEISRNKIQEENRALYERTISAENVEKVNKLCELANELNLDPYTLSTMFLTKGNKLIPFWEKIGRFIGTR